MRTRPAASVVGALLAATTLACASARAPSASPQPTPQPNAPNAPNAPNTQGAASQPPAASPARVTPGGGALSLPNADPFPSTYQPFPSRPTVIRNVTILTAAGPTIRNPATRS